MMTDPDHDLFSAALDDFFAHQAQQAPPRCPVCEERVPADAPRGICPRCLIKDGLSLSLASQGAYTFQQLPSPDELRQSLPSFEILERIGRGGMGVVYKAHDLTLNRVVALKILPPELADDPSFTERFAREARAVASLDHPNVVAIYAFDEDAELPYLVLEYVDGQNLRRHLLDAGGKLAPAEALGVLQQVADGLAYAHARGVIHRDVKPENVLVGRDGQVRLADFGLAKLNLQQSLAVSLTRTRQVMGTPHYMAPEQLEGRAVDARADVFSFGLLAYEVLTGRKPMGRFAPPSRYAPLPPRIDELILTCLALEPEERFPEAGAVAAAWREAAATRAPVDIRRDPTPLGEEELRGRSGSEYAGCRLGDYQLEDSSLGERIFLAEDLETSLPCVVTIHARAESSSEAQSARFLQRAHAAAHLEHPRVQRVLRAGSTPIAHEHYVVRARAAGSESLEERVARSGASSLPEALRIAQAVGEGLAYAHGQGCLHHALDPSCVWLGPGDEVRVGDFGRSTNLLSLRFDREGNPTGFTAPELGKGSALDARLDVYSLGVVFYLLVCGRNPFDGLDPLQRLTGHGRVLPPDPELGDEVRLVLAKLLAPEPEERYRDVPTALADLQALAQGHPPLLAQAHPSSLWTGPPPPASRPGWFSPIPWRNFDVVPTGLGLLILAAVVGVFVLIGLWAANYS